MHYFHFQYFRNTEQGWMSITGSILRLIYLWKNIRIHMCPHRTVPTILHIIIGIIGTTVQRFGIMHISTEHIRIQILYQLERPILPLSVIIIKINALLDNPQTDSITIIVNVQIFIRNAGQIGIIIAEVTRACYAKKPPSYQI